jgi:hypothetical protein
MIESHPFRRRSVRTAQRNGEGYALTGATLPSRCHEKVESVAA